VCKQPSGPLYSTMGDCTSSTTMRADRPQRTTVVEAPIEEFRRAIRLDLFGAFLGCRFGIPAIIASGGGSVINMASNVALMGVASLDCYTAAKGGIAAITRSMAVEFAPQKVRVNAIAPAATMTDRVRGRFASGNPRVTKIAAAHLIGLIEPDDIATTWRCSWHPTNRGWSQGTCIQWIVESPFPDTSKHQLALPGDQ
jgi:NAD(P)-dependent dehydrogenase (short-subunit alcohol dehydrogenase family)